MTQQDDQPAATITKVKLISVKVERLPDDNPDFSWIGEYSNQDRPGAIDRQARGDQGRNQYRYFIPAMTGEQSGNPELPEQDYQRMEAYNRDVWTMIGVKAKAEIAIPLPNYTPAQNLIQVITSGGIWGIESDAGDEYIKDEERNQLDELKSVLEFLNVDLSNWDELIKAAV